MRKVHPRGLRSRLAPDHRDRSSFPGRLQEISEDGKQGIFILLWRTLDDHQHNLPGKPRSILDLFFDVEEIRGYHFAFRASCGRRSGPPHRIHMQRPTNRREQFPLRHAARPSAPKLVIFRVHVFEADGFHLGHAPFFGFSFCRRSRHARTNVVAQFGEVLEGMRIHHPFACNLDERRLRAILIWPFRRRPVVCPRRPRAAQRKSQCHHCHSHQATSHPLSPYAFRAPKLYHRVRRARHGTVSSECSRRSASLAPNAVPKP